MLIRKIEYLAAKADLEKDYYVSSVPGQPNMVSLKRRPAQSRVQRQRAAQSEAVSHFKMVIRLAKAEYDDPAKRLLWQQEFKAYQETRRRHQRDPFLYHNHRVPNLWAYVQCVIRERLSASSADC